MTLVPAIPLLSVLCWRPRSFLKGCLCVQQMSGKTISWRISIRSCWISERNTWTLFNRNLSMRFGASNGTEHWPGISQTGTVACTVISLAALCEMDRNEDSTSASMPIRPKFRSKPRTQWRERHGGWLPTLACQIRTKKSWYRRIQCSTCLPRQPSSWTSFRTNLLPLKRHQPRERSTDKERRRK